MIKPSVREDFPILSTKVDDKPLVYLDNAATSQKPQEVIDALVEYYSKTNANIHRGIHYLSEKATEQYEESKRIIVQFINASSDKEIIYTRNTTESINLFAYSWALNNLSSGDLVLSTEMEHHSNIVPWQLIAKKTGSVIEYVPIKKDYSLDMVQYQKLLKKKPRIVTFVHASNVLGTINPAKKMTELAHEAGATVLIDGAQSTPHMKVDMKEIDCDFYAFSAHKMCGPTGIGVLYGKKKLLESMPPFLAGGDMIREVTYTNSTWNNLPWKFEAGTPNIADGIAFGTAIKYLDHLGMENIRQHIRELTSYTIQQLRAVDGLAIFGQDDSPKERGGVIAFTLKSAHPHDIAEILNEEGIAIRSGHHCAQPLHKKYNKASTARASIYFYNTKEDIDKLVESLHKVNKIFG